MILEGRQVRRLDGVGFAAHLLQRQKLRTSRISIRAPTFVHVVQGLKTVYDGRNTWTVAPGQLGVLPSGLYDLTNDPGATGVYEARSLSIELESVAPGPLASRFTGPASSAFVVSRCGDDLLDAFGRARRAILAEGFPLDVARHRVLEVLEWMRSRGYRLPAPEPRTTSDSVRDLITSSPATGWTAPAVAAELCVSAQTLRRRLQQQGESFSGILFDVRMSCALGLLQSTSMPVLQIALACGYDSPSRFTARFRERFGFTPTAVRKSNTSTVGAGPSIAAV